MVPPFYKRTRVIVYGSIILLATAYILYGVTHIDPLQLTVLHERQPLFIRMSDGSIVNKYTIKAVNKTGKNVPVRIKVEGMPVQSVLVNNGDPVVLPPANLVPFHVLVRARPELLKHEKTRITFELETESDDSTELEYKSVFVRPHEHEDEMESD